MFFYIGSSDIAIITIELWHIMYPYGQMSSRWNSTNKQLCFLYVSKSCCSCYDIKRLCIYIYIHYIHLCHILLSTPESSHNKKRLSWFNRCSSQHVLIQISSRALSFHLFFFAPCIYHTQPAFPNWKKIFLNLNQLKSYFGIPFFISA